MPGSVAFLDAEFFLLVPEIRLGKIIDILLVSGIGYYFK